MDAQNLWNMFLETGAPEVYLLYQRARKAENEHVLDDTGVGFEGNRLQ